MTEKRNFALRDDEGNEIGVFSGRQPRQAALKAANRHGGTKENPVIIKLRERGTKKVHVFSAWRELIDAPKNKPDWMPDKIHKPFVKKLRIEKLEKL
ncbi:MAG: non-histone chromosomal MC1 family protein [Methanosarcinales archaeon]